MMRVQRVHTRIESSTGGKGVWRVGVAKNETKRGFFRWHFEVLVVNTALHNVYS